MHISGTNFVQNINNQDYYVSKFPDVVGWATWKKDWKKLVKIINFKKIVSSKIVENYYNQNHSVAHWFYQYLYREINTKNGLWSTWWALTIIKNNGLSINPVKNLVYHDGYKLSDNPEHYESSYLIKNKFKLEKINNINFSNKFLTYNSFFDHKIIDLIKKTDPNFNLINLLRWKLKFLFIKMKIKKIKIKKLFF